MNHWRLAESAIHFCTATYINVFLFSVHGPISLEIIRSWDEQSDVVQFVVAKFLPVLVQLVPKNTAGVVYFTLFEAFYEFMKLICLVVETKAVTIHPYPYNSSKIYRRSWLYVDNQSSEGSAGVFNTVQNAVLAITADGTGRGRLFRFSSFSCLPVGSLHQ